MIKANIQINPNIVNQFIENARTLAINKLEAVSDKAFSLTIDEQVYNLRYEILEGEIHIFAQKPNTSENELVLPKLQLDFSDNFLPDAVHLNGADYNPDPMDFAHIIGEQDIDDGESAKILEEIRKIGLLQIIYEKK